MGEIQIEHITNTEFKEIMSTYNVYINDVKNYEVLSNDELIELLNDYRENGNMEAWERIINSNLRLVISVAKRYFPLVKTLTFMDIIQEGNLGLMRAVKTWNPEEGAFTTYAYYWIKQVITRAIADKDSEIRIPVHNYYRNYTYSHIIAECHAKNKPVPSDEELCKMLGCTLQMLEIIKNSFSLVSLNTRVGDEEHSELGEFICDPNSQYDELIDRMSDDDIYLILKTLLDPFQYYIVYHRILSDEKKTLEEIGYPFGLTRERIRQIEAKVLRKIRPYLTSEIKKKNILSKIRDQEGNLYHKIRKEPVSIDDVIKYVYIKDSLTDLERRLLYIKFFGKYKYEMDLLVRQLGVDSIEVKNTISSLSQKFDSVFADREKYKAFRKEMISKYGAKLLRVDVDYMFFGDEASLKEDSKQDEEMNLAKKNNN